MTASAEPVTVQMNKWWAGILAFVIGALAVAIFQGSVNLRDTARANTAKIKQVQSRASANHAAVKTLKSRVYSLETRVAVIKDRMSRDAVWRSPLKQQSEPQYASVVMRYNGT